MANLKWCWRSSARRIFEVDEVKHALSRLALPVHGALMEVDIQLLGGRAAGEGGRGRRLAGDSGLRHGAPEGARRGGLDPDKWQGFAFGMGIDRIAMLKYGIPTCAPSSKRPALAAALRLQRAGGADLEVEGVEDQAARRFRDRHERG
jgi:hypothetical protein